MMIGWLVVTIDRRTVQWLSEESDSTEHRRLDTSLSARIQVLVLVLVVILELA